MAAAEALNATVADMRFVKPLDEALVRQLAASHRLLVTVEENVIRAALAARCWKRLAAAGLDTLSDPGPARQLRRTRRPGLVAGRVRAGRRRAEASVRARSAA